MRSVEHCSRRQWRHCGKHGEHGEYDEYEHNGEHGHIGKHCRWNVFVAGNSEADGGSEVWKQLSGFDVRLSVNDSSKIPGCANSWYSMDGAIVQAAGGLSYTQNSDGTYTFTATDFVSGTVGVAL